VPRVADLTHKNQTSLEVLFSTKLVEERLYEILERNEDRFLQSVFKSRYLQSSPENIGKAESIIYDEISNHLAESIANPIDLWSRNIKKSLINNLSGVSSIKIEDEPDTWVEEDFRESDREIKNIIDKSMPEVDIIGMVDEYLYRTKIPVYGSIGKPMSQKFFPISETAKKALFRWSSIRFAAGVDEWTKDSKRSFWDLAGGSMTKCIKKVKSDMTDIDDPEAFCNKIKSGLD
jgi:hypothetical protein